MSGEDARHSDDGTGTCDGSIGLEPEGCIGRPHQGVVGRAEGEQQQASKPHVDKEL